MRGSPIGNESGPRRRARNVNPATDIGTRAGAESVKRARPGADNACGPGARYGCPTTTVKELRPMIFGRLRSLGRDAQAHVRGGIANGSRPSGARLVVLVMLAGGLL